MAKFGNFVSSENLPITANEQEIWKNHLLKLAKCKRILEDFVEDEEVYDKDNNHFKIKIAHPTNKTVQFQNLKGDKFCLEGVWLEIHKHAGTLKEINWTTGKIEVDKEHTPEFQYSLTICPIGIMKRKRQEKEQQITTRCPYDFGTDILEDFINGPKYFEFC